MIRGIKGFNDVRPGAREPFLDSAIWARMHDAVRQVLPAYGFAPVWLPLVESTELYTHGIGTQTDIVSKEMYSFTDRGERQMSLRPEGTAGAARAYIEHGLARDQGLQRWYYVGPMFRAERPQKGRYRQFYQIGAEMFGVADPAADVEMLLMVRHLCAELGIEDVALRLNTLGDADSRVAYREQLVAFLRAHKDALCSQCQQRTETNALRVLDCKNSACRAVLADAPDMLATLSTASRAWFNRYIRLLDQQGVPYERDRMLVRGLDYYAEAIFEVTTGALGAQDAILGGGRYDGLVPSLGGPAAPAVGFAAGMERLALLMAQHEQAPVGPQLFMAVPDAEAMDLGLQLATGLRARGMRVELDTSCARVKPALRRADRQGAALVLVLGDSERAAHAGSIKRLADGATQATALTPEALHAAALALLPAEAPGLG